MDVACLSPKKFCSTCVAEQACRIRRVIVPISRACCHKACTNRQIPIFATLSAVSVTCADSMPVRPVFSEFCSFFQPVLSVILLAQRAHTHIPLPCSQVPTWFVSHWWGEPVFAFLVCLRNHVKLRHLNIMDSAYWVCAYANNQWRLAGALVSQHRVLLRDITMAAVAMPMARLSESPHIQRQCHKL